MQQIRAWRRAIARPQCAKPRRKRAQRNLPTEKQRIGSLAWALRSGPAMKKGGKVYLIGAGPGDPELMTLKAVRALAAADVVLVDELVDRGCLAHARPGARVINVGKRGGCRSTPQLFIEKICIKNATAGHIVARLKGGDPFVFGRGGEEALALARAGIQCEVIPGVTAGIGIPAALGIPVTHRGVARGVTLLTGHTPMHDWAALRASGTTLVIYMGIARLPELVAGMLEAGFPSATPACAVQSGTLAMQREVVTTLGDLPAATAEAALGAPAIIVVGDVVRYARVAAALPARRTAGGQR
jgi:uroporphyrin-III C-methyltransferase